MKAFSFVYDSLIVDSEREYAGMVWIYMGPPDRTPELPHMPWTQVADDQRGVTVAAFRNRDIHRLRHLVIVPITTIKILTVAPELRSGRARVRSKRLVIWKNDGLLRL